MTQHDRTYFRDWEQARRDLARRRQRAIAIRWIALAVVLALLVAVVVKLATA